MPINSYEKRTTDLQDAFLEVVTTNEKTIAALNKGLAKDYAAMLKELKAVLASAHEKYAVDGRLTWIEMQRYDRIKKLETEIDAAIKKAYPPIRKQVVQVQKKVIEQTYTGSVSALNNATGMTVDPYITGDQIKDTIDKPWAGMALLSFLFLLQTGFGDKIINSIRRGLLGSGVTYEDAVKDLKEIVTKDYARMGRVNEDMSHSYQSDTQQNTMDTFTEKGVKVTKTWSTRMDERVRDSHAALEGATVDADDMFTFVDGDNAGEQTDGPGTSGIANEDCGCRCVLLADVRMREE